MLTRILISTLLLLSTHNIFSQNESGIPRFPELGVWSVSYLSGAIINTEGKNGYSLSMETAYKEGLSRQMFLNISFSKIFINTITRHNVIEFFAGPRLFFLRNKTLHTEAAFGIQIYLRKQRYNVWDYGYTGVSEKSHSAFYFSAGLGYDLQLSGATSLQLKIRYGTSIPSAKGISHFNVLAGFTSNVSETLPHRKSKISTVLLSASAGVVNPSDIRGNIYNGESLYSLEAAFRTSPRKEIWLEGGYFSYNINFSSPRYRILFFNIGPRYFINQSSFSAFLEFGGGMVFLIDRSKKTATDPLQPGINCGAGVINKFSERFSLFIKGKLNFIISENIYSPHYSSLTGGVRINL